MVRGLEVTDMDENNIVFLPEVLYTPQIPVSKDEIPTQEDIDRWKYLQEHVHMQNINSEVELLIGANVPEALQPMQVISSQNGGSHASKVALGWVINGPVGRKIEKSLNASFFVKTKVHPMRAVCTDFIDACNDHYKEMSRDDQRFMEIVENTVKKNADDHYQISLPIKSEDIMIPNNRPQALNRLSYLKRKLQNDSKLRKGYSEFISDIIDKGYAEKVPAEKLSRCDGRVWYLPHHGVYHPKKPEKIRVVFDCPAEYQEKSLNQQLFQGPDLTNNLIGVLVWFRQYEVAYMTDVESMFH